MIPFDLWERCEISRWKIAALRVIFPRRQCVQIGKKVYLLRVLDDLTRSEP